MRLQADRIAADLPVGAELHRRWGGEEHRVKVIAPVRTTRAAMRRRWWRYEYLGDRYKTLTAVVRAITGDRKRSGNRFFGLKEVP